MIRGWKTVTLLIKNEDFTAREIEAIKQFSAERSFDVAYTRNARRGGQPL